MKKDTRIHKEQSKKGVNNQPKTVASAPRMALELLEPVTPAQKEQICRQAKWGKGVRATLKKVHLLVLKCIASPTPPMTIRTAEQLGVFTAKLNLGFLRIEEGACPKTLVGVPQIILQGHWLEESGFQIGQAAQVTVRQDGVIELKRFN